MSDTPNKSPEKRPPPPPPPKPAPEPEKREGPPRRIPEHVEPEKPWPRK